jgi:hypothetical protein
MSVALGEYELEGLGEHEFEFESELEGESEMPEMFGFGDIKNWANRQWGAVRKPGSWQNTAVRLADRAILAAAPNIGAAIGGDRGENIGKALQSAGLAIIPAEWRESEFESEFEFESEHEFEGEGEISPVTRVYPDAMMEHMALAAMEAENEHEAAEGFLPLIPLIAGKLLPLAAKMAPKIAGKLLPQVARAITRVTPQLNRGVGNLTRTLYRNPQTRPLIRTIPSVARRAVTTIAKQAAAGHPVTPRGALQVLARANHNVLSNPKIVNSVMQKSRAMDGQAHRIAGLPAGTGHHPSRLPGSAGPIRIGGHACPRCGTAAVNAGHRRNGGCGPVIIVR